MKNVYVCDQFGAGSLYSGPGNYFVNLINANPNNKYSFHLVHGNKSQKKSTAFDCNHYVSDSGSRVKDLIYSLKVKKLISNTNIDIIQTTHSYLGSISAAEAGIKNNIPTYLRIAKSKSELVDRNFVAKFLNLSKKKLDVINASDGVVAISKEIENELLSLGVSEEKIRYIPNGVDLARFNIDSISKDFKFPFSKDCRAIGFCGALIERKRPHLLLESLKKLPEEYVACFIGPYDDSPYVQNMMNYINDNGLSQRVHFTGYISNPESYLTYCDYFCLPSMNEGMPNALLEAMACKCIPISTDISGVTDIITDDNVGFIVKPTANDISDVILSTCSEQAQLSNAAYNKIATSFSATVAFQKYIDMYEGNL
ncbi:glycosyltransferase family 4 protein [Photobacterium sanguinicancri]|uniref:glycosyltransferase family 4 protein n=1 Tax=Photobacterium sanguinicancri TaxID=875932 RepID=UPI00248043F9|nr:glycosyltransferase family 4 protein [Photobacterium sanguinicancri]